jgi:putative spermidine/putrescine transport system permease protein
VTSAGQLAADWDLTVGDALTAPSGPQHTMRWVRRSAGAGASGILVIGLGLFIIAPLAIMLVWAFAESWFYPSAVPSVWTLSWWTTVFDTPGLSSAIEQSFIFAPVVTAVSAVICLPAAYVFARRDFPGKRLMMMLVFATNAFPKMGLYIAIASLFYSFNLMGTFTGVVIIQLLNTLVIMTWIPAAAFASVPVSLEEAAQDAGAGPVRTFWRVTLPLARPGLLVALILAFLASLDEAQGTFLVGVPKYITMPTEMYSLVSSYPGPATAVFAILLTVPSLVLLLLVRKYVFSSTLAEGYRLR